MIYQVHVTHFTKKGVTITVLPKVLHSTSPYFVKESIEAVREIAPNMKGKDFHYFFEVADTFVSWFKEQCNVN